MCSPAGRSSNLLLSGFYEGFITQAWLIQLVAVGGWFHLQQLFPPENQGVETKSSNTIVPWLVPWQQAQLLGEVQMTPLSLHHLEISKGIWFRNISLPSGNIIFPKSLLLFSRICVEHHLQSLDVTNITCLLLPGPHPLLRKWQSYMSESKSGVRKRKAHEIKKEESLSNIDHE